jgi:hypothetical protein
MSTSLRGRVILAVLVVMAVFAAAPAAHAADNDPLFDFTDRFYRANGVNASRILGRPTGADGISVVDEAPDAAHRDVRMLLHIPAYDHSGGLAFWSPTGSLNGDGFTKNDAGRAARALAESSKIFLFPRAGTNPLGIDKRQEDIVDLRNGYFSNNPLGLWVNVFVSYTPAALDTAAGHAALADLAARNGVDRDGTPIIRTISEIEDLTAEGFVRQRTRPANGNAGPRYTICPVLEDPRDGAIPADAFLAVVRRDDGTVLPASQEFVTNFASLQTTGDWAG